MILKTSTGDIGSIIHIQGGKLISNQKGYYEIEYVNKEGRIDGVFARYSNNNEFWCAYTYENGVLSGPAKLLSSNGGYEYKFYYLGEEANLYKNDKLEFYGKLDENGYAISGKVNLPDGRIYIGSFERGKLTGKNSKIYFSNGDVFIGEVKDGEPVNGTMTYKKQGHV